MGWKRSLRGYDYYLTHKLALDNQRQLAIPCPGNVCSAPVPTVGVIFKDAALGE